MRWNIAPWWLESQLTSAGRCQGLPAASSSVMPIKCKDPNSHCTIEFLLKVSISPFS